MKKPGRGAAPPSVEEFESHLEDLDRRLDRLRALYESFFLGIERAPPNVPRRELNRRIVEMQQTPITNPTLRFRFQAIMQRWVLYTAYWNRTLREIEAGTYRRDLARAQRHLAKKGGAITEEEALALGIPSGRVKAFVERQQKMQAGRAGRAAAAEKPAPPDETGEASRVSLSSAELPAFTGVAPAAVAARPEPAIPGLDDAELDRVYQNYVETCQKMNDPRGSITRDKLREKLRAQVPKLLEQRGARKVALDVAVEDGRVRLKARPVKE